MGQLSRRGQQPLAEGRAVVFERPEERRSYRRAHHDEQHRSPSRRGISSSNLGPRQCHRLRTECRFAQASRLRAQLTGGSAASHLQPELVTARVKVRLSLQVGYRAGRLARVRTKRSRIARATLTARMRTGRLSAGIVRRRIVLRKVSRNAGADLRLDPSTIAAHALGFQLGYFAADPAGPFHLSLREQTQIHLEHGGPPSPNVDGVRWEGGGERRNVGPVVVRIPEGCQRGDQAARDEGESQSRCRRQPPTRINWLARNAASIWTLWPTLRVNQAQAPDPASRDLSEGTAALRPTDGGRSHTEPTPVRRWPNAHGLEPRISLVDALASG
jgi:hypothetical protein